MEKGEWIEALKEYRRIGYLVSCKCQYKNAQKVENKNVHFPTILPRIVFPKRLAFP